MKKKGFTLIELLAVIIILAVIALIATPIVLNVVDNAKESARQSSVSGYADATRLAVAEYQFGHSGKIPKLDQAFIDTIKPQGSTVSCANVIYSNEYGVVLNKCKVVPDNNEYCFVSGKTYSDCNNQEFTEIYNTMQKFHIGDTIFYNPVTNNICSDYIGTNSNCGVKEGCLKWYIYKIEEDNVRLLLDHNTTLKTYATSNQLALDTENWAVKASKILVQDILNVIGYQDWDKKTNFYFDSKSTTPAPDCSTGNTDSCKYGWLYDRTSINCKTYGCLNNSYGITDGYWTMNTAPTTSYYWYVGAGLLNSKYYSDTNWKLGIRPTISISKFLLNV